MAQELTVDLPRKLFKNPFGFTMDFGGSVVKMLYTSEVEDKIRVHFVTHTRETHEEAFQILEEKCSGRLPPGTDVNICGLGGSEFKDHLTEKLGLNFVNTNEIDRLIEGFQFLATHLPWDEFTLPVSETALAKASVIAGFNKMIMTMMPESKFKPPPYTQLDKYQSGSDEDTLKKVEYPVLIFLVGSGGGGMKVNEDGTYEFCDSSTMAGRAFLGLGSLLTDGKGFPEICDMASRGEQNKVDIMADNIKVDPNDKLYGLLKHEDNAGSVDMKVFAFGHAVGKNREDFKQEDLSIALISLFAEAFAGRAFMWANIHKVKQVFFLGGFTSTNKLIQDEIQKLFTFKKFLCNTGFGCDCHFLKLGQHCGAFGTLLMNLGQQTSS